MSEGHVIVKFVQPDESQLYLLPIDTRYRMVEGDLTHCPEGAADWVPMVALLVNERDHGCSALLVENDGNER